MSRRQHTPRTMLGLGAAVLALTACGAGQRTQTDSQVAPVNGAYGDVGDMSLRNALLAYPEDGGSWDEGEDVPLSVTIANESDRADELVDVRSEAAADVEVTGTTVVPAGIALSSTFDERTAAVAAGSPPSRSPGAPVDSGELSIVLTDLTGPIRPGLPTFVTFTFRDAGEVTLRVPVSNPEGPRAESGEGGAEDESGEQSRPVSDVPEEPSQQPGPDG